MLETYPTGRPTFPDALDPDAVGEGIARIEALPGQLRAALDGCADLDQRIREGAWTIRQVVHHLADAHVHAFVRTKLAALADAPAVVSYDVDAWARSADTDGAAEPSLAIVDGVHTRWARLLRSLDAAALERTWHVPARGATYPLWRLPVLYGWHGAHHVAQIEQARAHYGV